MIITFGLFIAGVIGWGLGGACERARISQERRRAANEGE
jgi:hypothetical protein